MKDEIKEILATLGNKECYINDEMLIYFDDAKLLLDYITNLQEDLEKVSASHFDLFEENEKNKEYSEFYKDMSDKWKDMSDVFKESCNDYKSRCEKAIQREMELSYLCDTQPDEELLKILQGEDKDENN